MNFRFATILNYHDKGQDVGEKSIVNERDFQLTRFLAVL